MQTAMAHTFRTLFSSAASASSCCSASCCCQRAAACARLDVLSTVGVTRRTSSVVEADSLASRRCAIARPQANPSCRAWQSCQGPHLELQPEKLRCFQLLYGSCTARPTLQLRYSETCGCARAYRGCRSAGHRSQCSVSKPAQHSSRTAQKPTCTGKHSSATRCCPPGCISRTRGLAACSSFRLPHRLWMALSSQHGSGTVNLSQSEI